MNLKETIIRAFEKEDFRVNYKFTGDKDIVLGEKTLQIEWPKGYFEDFLKVIHTIDTPAFLPTKKQSDYGPTFSIVVERAKKWVPWGYIILGDPLCIALSYEVSDELS
ncbi:MAG: hypothetical protein M0Q12_05125 [Synergistaceae bacterium]|jgi:hypothetical protein|nr:hypothetical protein [Synergistaceae bacterium]